MSIIDTLITKGVNISSDWSWYKQMTFAQEGYDNVKINMANTTFDYTF